MSFAGPEGLRILMLSVHGLVRARSPQLGRDADTGGQVGYVLELARALGEDPRVSRVDIVTRLIEDPQVEPDYAVPEEPIGPKARLVRLRFGPPRYVRKELLWSHLDHLVDRCLEHVRAHGTPHVIHGHYADAGYVGVRLAHLLGVPFLFTAHSLGRVKRRRLLAAGRKETALERQFNFRKRFAAEEEALEQASFVVASTWQEVTEQWALYEGAARGRFRVLPPGIETSRFAPPRAAPAPENSRWIDRFLERPELPMIVAVARAAPKKNLAGLLTAYGESPALRERANLVIVAGTRDDVREMEEPTREVLTQLLFLLDRYDLWGKVALPKRHEPRDVPALFRLATSRHGVFVNVAFNEPFGLTLVEAAASGLPVVATADGGPREIVGGCRNGLLVDSLDTSAIAATLEDALSDPARWRRWSKNGLTGAARLFSWKGHTDRYITACQRLLQREKKRLRRGVPRAGEAPRLAGVTALLVCDIDDTLLGDREGLAALLRWRERCRGAVAFAVATGRTVARALEVLHEWEVPPPDVLVAEVGTVIRYGPGLLIDAAWARHIRHGYRRDALAEALARVPGLTPQRRANQAPLKLSYDVDPKRFWKLERVSRLLRERGLRARLVYSQSRFLDVLPERASKGLAIRHLAFRLGVPLQRVLVAGDSGNDLDMLRGETLGVVVANHKPELNELMGTAGVYFAKTPCAQGILEGIAHYGFPECGTVA